MSYLENAAHYLISVFFGLIAIILLLRVLMQLVRANYYNPVSQFILKITNPIMIPIGKVIPRWRNLDIAALLLAWVVKSIELTLLTSLDLTRILGFAAVGIIDLSILILMVVMFIMVIFSWISPYGNNPVHTVARQLTQPILMPFRRFIPPIAGFDFSVFFAIIALQLVRILAIAPLYDLIKQI